jgi:hypothetical protein
MSNDAETQRAIDLLFIKSMFYAKEPLKEIAAVTGYSEAHISVLARINGCLPRHGGAQYGTILKNKMLWHQQRRRRRRA